VLTIPAEWVGQPLRCKHCGAVMQAHARGPAAAGPAPADPFAADAPAGGGDPFDVSPAVTRRANYRRTKGGSGLLAAGIIIG